MKKIFFLLLLVTGFSSFIPLHKFYVSVTEIEHNEKAQSLQIISRVFTDDLENLLQKRYDPDLRLTANAESADVSSYLGKYLDQKLKIKVDGKPVQINYLGKEYENDLILLYLEIPNVGSFRKISVENTILMDLFQEQKNLVHVEYQGKIKSLVLNNERPNESLNF